MTLRVLLLTFAMALSSLASPVRSMLGRERLEAPRSNLPYDVEVEYLEFPKYNGNMPSHAFIDTGIVPSLPCDISGHISFARAVNIQAGVGCGWGNNGTLFYPLLAYYNPYRLAVGFPNSGLISFEEYSASGADAVFSTSLDAGGNGYAEVNGVIRNVSNAFGGRNLTETILIGGAGHIQADGLPTYKITWGSRIYWVNIQCGDKELDLVPVRFTNEEGISEGALYDYISGKLFRNAGLGSFIIGPDL